MDSTPLEQRDLRYDVFLSFRGPDTRMGFTDHLYHSLRDAGIDVFRDDEQILLGETITSLFHAIQSSRISVVIFSESFAGSLWCLEELVQIMNCRKNLGQTVLPVFYGVDPSEVRNQTHRFGEELDKHQSRFPAEKIGQWKAALREAGNLSGWRTTGSVSEALLIQQIVRHISRELKEVSHLHVAAFPVGLDSRVPDIDSLLWSGSGGVQFVGILGMGGIGKTTVAKALYNRLIHQFEGVCFLADVRINSQQPNDLVKLQERLLKDVLKLKERKVELNNTDRGITVIKKRLYSRNVLVVLDDVSDISQVRALAGGRDWFGSGSRIILTTRNRDLLKTIKVDETYEAQQLNDAESLELFSKHAFGKSLPEEEFMGLSRQIVSYCTGVPLALQVLGSSLSGKSQIEWGGTIQKLKTIPHDHVQEKLRISYDTLGDDKRKGLFLDIACFFIGYSLDYAMTILQACDLHPLEGMSYLFDRCLVQVDNDKNLKMHDLLRDMGREIVRDISPNNPGGRSRLWLYNDVKSTLRSSLGTITVEGMTLNSEKEKELTCNTKAFKKMSRLRLLHVNNLHVQGDYELMSKELRWLCWHKFPLSFIPDEFHLEEVAAIDMQHSKLNALFCHEKQVLLNLKVLNLSHSPLLTKTPDFSKLPNLEELILEECVELALVDQSIGHLDKLVLVNFKNCRKLRNIPESFSRVKSLKTFNISGCSLIDRLPGDLGKIELLTELLADGTSIAQVPASTTRLSKLTHLSLGGCRILNSTPFVSIMRSWIPTGQDRWRNVVDIAPIFELNTLKVLKLMDLNLSDDAIPPNIGNLLSLEDLDLRNNHFCCLPDTVSCLPKLKNILVDGCKNLISLPDMPASLFSLSAVYCSSLDRVCMSRFGPGTRVFLSGCSQLRMIYGLKQQLQAGGSIHLERCSRLTSEFKEFLLKEWCGHGSGSIFLPGSDIPEWFDHQGSGSSLTFKVPTFEEPKLKLKGFTICIIYACNEDNKESNPFPIVYLAEPFPRPDQHKPLQIDFSAVSSTNVALTHDDHMWVFYLPDSIVDDKLESVDEVKLSVSFGDGWTVKGLGVCFGRDNANQSRANPETSAGSRSGRPGSGAPLRLTRMTSH